MSRKDRQTNTEAAGPYLLELLSASFEHLQWTVQQLTQEAHSASVKPQIALAPSCPGKGRKVTGGMKIMHRHR